MIQDPRVVIPYHWRVVLDCSTTGIVSGLATLLVTWCIERFGGIVGGLLGTVPSCIVVSAIGLFFLESPVKLSMSMNTVPIASLINILLLAYWRLLPGRLPRSLSTSRRLLLILGLSLVSWILLAYATLVLIEFLKSKELPLDIAGAISLLIFVVVVMMVTLIPDLPVGRKGDSNVTQLGYLVRFILGMGATTSAILLSTWNEIAGGLVLAFPAVMVTSLGSLWISQSETVSVSASSPIILGSATNSIFAMAFAWSVPILEDQFGPILGLAISIAASWYISVYGFSFPVLALLRKKEIISSRKVPHIKFIEDVDINSNDEYYPTTNTIPFY